MDAYKCLVPIKYNGEWTIPDQVVEFKENEVIEHLLHCKAIVLSNKKASLTPFQNLQKVNGVTPQIAKYLIEDHITTVEKLSAYSVEELQKIRGIKPSVAEKIFKSFGTE